MTQAMASATMISRKPIQVRGLRFVAAVLVSWLALAVARAALPVPAPDDGNGEFQFAATFSNQGVDTKEPHDFKAYLWIPPHCEKLRGVIVTQQNVGEQVFSEHPLIRAVCAKHDLAILWCYPAIDMRFRERREDATKLLENVLVKLGRVSGYDELGRVGWITFGHSSTTIFSHHLAVARPERTIAILTAKGFYNLPDLDRYEGPVFYSAGQFPEWKQPTHDWTAHGASLPDLAALREQQAKHFRALSYVEENGGGHFDYSEPFMRFLALWLDKAAQYRLNADGSIRPLDLDAGWVVDLRTPLPLPPMTMAPYAQATGALRNAPWFFDRETAEAAVALMGGNWQRKNQIVGFANLDGMPAAFHKSGIADPVPMQVADDGVTITRIPTTFLEQLPAGFTQAGMKFGHVAGAPRTLERVSGVFAVEDGKYRIKLNRGYPETPNFIAVRTPGNAEYRPSVQPGRLVVPEYSDGLAQTIDFAPLADVRLAADRAQSRTIPLRATSSRGLKVEYFVREGPARIAGDRLELLPLPPRTHYPVRVTVVAWQLGHGGASPVSAAPMVERSFLLDR